MDYDKTEIASSYDKARALAPQTVRLWQHLLSLHIDRAAISPVINLGCGTGRFSELLASHFGVQVIGTSRRGGTSSPSSRRAALRPGTRPMAGSTSRAYWYHEYRAGGGSHARAFDR
jgi:hypothetical protein